MQISERIYNTSLKSVFKSLKTKLRPHTSRSGNAHHMNAIVAQLQEKFKFYQTSNLQLISAEAFTKHIQSNIGIIDAQSEGYSKIELEQQRDLSIKFHWGHNHDFGNFHVQGLMRDRHIRLLANFVDLFPVSLEDFTDKKVFDIGCWTGGTTLLLASLGSTVFAIEEVKKYAEMVSFLSKSFGIQNQVSSKSLSIYNCNSKEFYDQFDIVYFPGVIYHLSDPLLALRILFNSLKVGGIILVESLGINVEEPFCRFDGSQLHNRGTKEELSRTGWNWFIPSTSALCRMMQEAGFDQVETTHHDGTQRIYGYGKKVSQGGICKAGLSIPSIR